jgi:hypothetical protein
MQGQLFPWKIACRGLREAARDDLGGYLETGTGTLQYVPESHQNRNLREPVPVSRQPLTARRKGLAGASFP